MRPDYHRDLVGMTIVPSAHPSLSFQAPSLVIPSEERSDESRNPFLNYQALVLTQGIPPCASLSRNDNKTIPLACHSEPLDFTRGKLSRGGIPFL